MTIWTPGGSSPTSWVPSTEPSTSYTGNAVVNLGILGDDAVYLGDDSVGTGDDTKSSTNSATPTVWSTT